MRLGKVRFQSKYMAIQYFYENKHWSIRWMCSRLDISKAAYYKWVHRTIPQAEQENLLLAELIREYDEQYSHILGYRRMTVWINRFNGTHFSRNRIHRIMQAIGIHSVIRKQPKKYKTFLKQAGAGLSHGQRQLMSIARAVLADPKILILDDSTSAVDTATEKRIRAAFANELKGSTKIIIAQRIASVEKADIIIVMNNGTVDAVGNHEQLLATNEIYREVYEQQTNGGAQDGKE